MTKITWWPIIYLVFIANWSGGSWIPSSRSASSGMLFFGGPKWMSLNLTLICNHLSYLLFTSLGPRVNGEYCLSAILFLELRVCVVVQLKSESRWLDHKCYPRLTMFLISDYLFSAWWDRISSRFGLNRTPYMSLTLVTHIGNVGVFKREPNFHFIVFSSVLSHIRNPMSFRLITPCLSLPYKRDHFDRFNNLFRTLTDNHNPTFSMPMINSFLSPTCDNRATLKQHLWSERIGLLQSILLNLWTGNSVCNHASSSCMILGPLFAIDTIVNVRIELQSKELIVFGLQNVNGIYLWYLISSLPREFPRRPWWLFRCGGKAWLCQGESNSTEVGCNRRAGQRVSFPPDLACPPPACQEWHCQLSGYDRQPTCFICLPCEISGQHEAVENTEEPAATFSH